ncbi:MAG: S1C family serine protease [Verrucomicrobia bacterium]|jgi:hypothetical protein|nr:S1C family serine protease [Verrucomicrobiota bacterium]
MKSITNLGFLGIGLLLLAGCGKIERDLKPEEIWSRVSPSVVRVEAKSLEGDTVIGSGFVCELQGKKFILSNRHVVLGAKEVRVGSSEDTLVVAPSYRISPELDLALIDLPPSLQIAPLRTRAGGLKIGERVFAIGFPLGLNKSITQGLVSSETEKLVQFDASISSGSSGGPLVDKAGAALGVVTAGSKSSGEEIAQNLNFAIKTAFVPKAELFKEPIVRFYDAWRALVTIENKLINDLQDLRVFDVETCVQAEVALPLAFALDKDMANLDPGKKKEVRTSTKASYAEELDRVIQRHGSLESGVKSVVAFLRSKVSEFGKVPELFAGLGSDDLLRSFVDHERVYNPYDRYIWDIKLSQISPLLKVSIEFAKAKYEDKAFQIEFDWKLVGRLKSGDTNIIAAFRRVHEWKSAGERNTVRLPYDKLRANCSDDELVKTSRLCGQKFCERSGATQHTGSEKVSVTETISEGGGFESEITEMFTPPLDRIERGDVAGSIRSIMNEVELRRYPNLKALAFLHACQGDFEKAYNLYAKAYTETLNMINPFSLRHDYSELRFDIRWDLVWPDSVNWTQYPDAVRRNLADWQRFTKAKPAFLLTKVRLADAIASPVFKELSEFEKCWLLGEQRKNALNDGKMNLEEFGERLSRFEATIKQNPEAYKLYQKYSRGNGL